MPGVFEALASFSFGGVFCTVASSQMASAFLGACRISGVAGLRERAYSLPPFAGMGELLYVLSRKRRLVRCRL